MLHMLLVEEKGYICNENEWDGAHPTLSSFGLAIFFFVVILFESLIALCS